MMKALSAIPWPACSAYASAAMFNPFAAREPLGIAMETYAYTGENASISIQTRF